MTKGIHVHVYIIEIAAFLLYYGENNSGFNFLSINIASFVFYLFFCSILEKLKIKSFLV